MIDKTLLRIEMVRNGYSQRSLCKAIGMSEQTFIRNIKNGKLGLDDAKRIASVLHIEDPNPIFFASEVTCQVPAGKDETCQNP